MYRERERQRERQRCSSGLRQLLRRAPGGVADLVEDVAQLLLVDEQKNSNTNNNDNNNDIIYTYIHIYIYICIYT